MMTDELVLTALLELAEEAHGNGNDWKHWAQPRMALITSALARQPAAIGKEAVEAAWQTGTPPTKAGDYDEYIVAVKRKHAKDPSKVFVFATNYANAYTDDDSMNDSDGNPFTANGWYSVGSDMSGEFSYVFEKVLSEGDEVVGWQSLPKWDAAPLDTGASKTAVQPLAWMDPSDQNDATAFTRDANEAHCNPDMFSVALTASPAAPSVEQDEPTDYEAIEREHLGDAEKRTGIYAPKVEQDERGAFDLPPLPDPIRTFADHSCRAYSRQQMIDYARAASTSANVAQDERGANGSWVNEPPRMPWEGEAHPAPSEDERAAVDFYANNPSAALFDFLKSPRRAANHAAPSVEQDERGADEYLRVTAQKLSDMGYLWQAENLRRAVGFPVADGLNERAMFEAWAKAQRMDLAPFDDTYDSDFTSKAWDAWQARAASTSANVRDERGAFEAWATGKYSTRYIGTYMDRDADAYERTKLAEAALDGWQARAASTSANVAQGAEAAMQIEQYVLSVLPSVYYMDPPDGGSVSVLEQLRRMADDAAKYRASTAQPALADDARAASQPDAPGDELPITVSDELHPDTAKLVRRFARALANKLLAAQRKYGYGASWTADDWQEKCRADLMDHVAKGDPRDVAAYCAFMWHHNWPTAAAKPVSAAAAQGKLP